MRSRSLPAGVFPIARTIISTGRDLCALVWRRLSEHTTRFHSCNSRIPVQSFECYTDLQEKMMQNRRLIRRRKHWPCTTQIKTMRKQQMDQRPSHQFVW